MVQMSISANPYPVSYAAWFVRHAESLKTMLQRCKLWRKRAHKTSFETLRQEKFPSFD